MSKLVGAASTSPRLGGVFSDASEDERPRSASPDPEGPLAKMLMGLPPLPATLQAQLQAREGSEVK